MVENLRSLSEKVARSMGKEVRLTAHVDAVDVPACLAALRSVLPEARVLVVSALSDRATALKALTKGAHGFLLKPFSDEQLVESLQELMA